MKTCSKCSFNNADDAVKCVKCGEDLIITSKRRLKNLAIKVAATAIIVNAIIVLIESFFIKDQILLGSPVNSVVTSVIIGVLLLVNRKGALTWAKVAIILGAIVFTALFIYKKDYFSAVFQLFFSLSLLGLIIGSPSKARVVAASSIIAVCFLLEIVGIVSLASGNNIIQGIYLRSTQSLQGIPKGEVSGSYDAYTVKVPGGSWKQRKREAALRDNPVADMWLINPEKDAHLIIVFERKTDASNNNIDTLVASVITNARQGFKDVKVKSKEKIKLISGCEGVELIVEGKSDNAIIVLKYGLFTINQYSFQLAGISMADKFDRNEKDFDSIISTFKPNIAVLNSLIVE